MNRINRVKMHNTMNIFLVISCERKNSKRYGFTILDNFQFIGGMKVGEPSADGRGSAPPELAEQQARAGSEAAPATPPL